MFAPFDDHSADPAIHGFLHIPANPSGNAIALTHGAGANCRTKLLIEVSDALASCGFLVLRFDLPFRLARPTGPPRPGSAEHDREGLRRAAAILKSKLPPRADGAPGHVFLAGHSYGGRQATLLLADHPDVADGLLLLSYPLHPPRKPDQLRTQHLPRIRKPAYFVHGARDPFGSLPEMHSALALIPAPHAILELEGSGHDLMPRTRATVHTADIAEGFERFLARLWPSGRHVSTG